MSAIRMQQRFIQIAPHDSIQYTNVKSSAEINFKLMVEARNVVYSLSSTDVDNLIFELNKSMLQFEYDLIIMEMMVCSEKRKS